MTDDPAKRLTYHVAWSEADREYVGTCPLYPSLSWLDFSQISALEGIVSLVRQSLEDTTRERPEPPISASSADTKPEVKKADALSAEIIRLGSLLDDAVDLLVVWEEDGEKPPYLRDDTLRLLEHPKIAPIVEALAPGRGRQRAPTICPACGADYAKAFRFAELEVVRLKKALPGGGGFVEDMPDLPAGAVGTIVHVHTSTGYEVEFADDDGKTLRVATLTADALEKVKP